MAGPLNEQEIRYLDVVQQLLWVEQSSQAGVKPTAYGYPINFNPPAIGMSTGVPFPATLAIQADSWFLWTYVSMAVQYNSPSNFGGPEQFTDGGNMLMQFSLPGAGGDLESLPPGFAGMPGALSCGSPIGASAGIPFQFPNPIMLPPRSNVQIQATKLGTGADNPDPVGCYAMIHGFKIPDWTS